MAKIHRDRLRQRYGYRGGNIRELTSGIIARNSQQIRTTLARSSERNYQKAAKKMKRGSRLVVPAFEEALPAESVTISQAAIRSDRISGELRERLRRDMRESLETFSGRTGEPSFFTRRGRTAGRVNPQLVKDFENRIKGTFANYASNAGSPYGVPRNVQAIAVDEVRTAASEIKTAYAERMLEENPGLVITKTWIHNRHLSKEPRPHHQSIDGQTRLFEDDFTLGNGVNIAYPHDPTADISETANCHCDMDIRLRREVQEI